MCYGGLSKTIGRNLILVSRLRYENGPVRETVLGSIRSLSLGNGKASQLSNWRCCGNLQPTQRLVSVACSRRRFLCFVKSSDVFSMNLAFSVCSGGRLFFSVIGALAEEMVLKFAPANRNSFYSVEPHRKSHHQALSGLRSTSHSPFGHNPLELLRFARFCGVVNSLL